MYVIYSLLYSLLPVVGLLIALSPVIIIVQLGKILSVLRDIQRRLPPK